MESAKSERHEVSAEASPAPCSARLAAATMTVAPLLQPQVKRRNHAQDRPSKVRVLRARSADACLSTYWSLPSLPTIPTSVTTMTAVKIGPASSAPSVRATERLKA